MATFMVMRWGMNSFGKIGLIGTDGKQRPIGPTLQDKIDAEVPRILNECYDIAMQIVVAEEPRFWPNRKDIAQAENHRAGAVAGANEAVSKPV